MTTLTEFLLARIDEDEDLAHRAAERDGAEEWQWIDPATDEPLTGPQYEGVIQAPLTSVAKFPAHSGLPWDLPLYVTSADGCPEIRWEGAVHIARWDPARVLAECEAKRRLVLDIRENYSHPGGVESTDGLAGRALEYLALPYATHPEFREEWR